MENLAHINEAIKARIEKLVQEILIQKHNGSDFSSYEEELKAFDKRIHKEDFEVMVFHVKNSWLRVLYLFPRQGGKQPWLSDEFSIKSSGELDEASFDANLKLMMDNWRSIKEILVSHSA